MPPGAVNAPHKSSLSPRGEGEIEDGRGFRARYSAACARPSRARSNAAKTRSRVGPSGSARAAWRRRRKVSAAAIGMGAQHGAVEDAGEILAAAAVRVAIALEEPRALGDLARELGRARRRVGDGVEPRLDGAILLAEAVAHPPPAPHLRQQPQPRIAADAGALEPHPQMEPLAPPVLLAPALERAAQDARQDRAHLVDAGLQELGQADRLVGPRADFLAHLGEALGPDLEVGDADHVLIRHPQREMAGHRGGERAVRAVERGDAAGAVEIEPRIGQVLVIDEAANPFLDQRRRLERKLLAHRGDERGRRRVGLARRAVVLRRELGRDAVGSQLPAGGEGGEVGVGGDAGRADRRLERVARHGHRARRRGDAEQHRVERQVARAFLARQVEQDGFSGERLARRPGGCALSSNRPSDIACFSAMA